MTYIVSPQNAASDPEYYCDDKDHNRSGKSAEVSQTHPKPFDTLALLHLYMTKLPFSLGNFQLDAFFLLQDRVADHFGLLGELAWKPTGSGAAK